MFGSCPLSSSSSLYCPGQLSNLHSCRKTLHITYFLCCPSPDSPILFCPCRNNRSIALADPLHLSLPLSSPSHTITTAGSAIRTTKKLLSSTVQHWPVAIPLTTYCPVGGQSLRQSFISLDPIKSSVSSCHMFKCIWNIWEVGWCIIRFSLIFPLRASCNLNVWGLLTFAPDPHLGSITRNKNEGRWTRYHTNLVKMHQYQRKSFKITSVHKILYIDAPKISKLQSMVSAWSIQSNMMKWRAMNVRSCNSNSRCLD